MAVRFRKMNIDAGIHDVVLRSGQLVISKNTFARKSNSQCLHLPYIHGESGTLS
jgi:hypothetical protein